MNAMKQGQIFLLDVLLDGAMLLLAMRFAALPVRWKRILIAALFGAGCARATDGFSTGAKAAFWVPVAMGMMAIAAGRRKLIRSALLLLCAAGLLGGTIQALGGAFGSKTLGILLGACTVFVLAGAASRARRAGQSVKTLRVTLDYGGRKIHFDALVDSGNCLRDYLTQKPVIVVPEAKFRKSLRLEEKALRPIFADTAGGRQMMWLLAPEEIRISDGKSEQTVCAMLALSPGMQQNAPALFPASLLQRDRKEGA